MLSWEKNFFDMQHFFFLLFPISLIQFQRVGRIIFTVYFQHNFVFHYTPNLSKYEMPKFHFFGANKLKTLGFSHYLWYGLSEYQDIKG